MLMHSPTTYTVYLCHFFLSSNGREFGGYVYGEIYRSRHFPDSELLLTVNWPTFLYKFVVLLLNFREEKKGGGWDIYY